MGEHYEPSVNRTDAPWDFVNEIADLVGEAYSVEGPELELHEIETYVELRCRSRVESLAEVERLTLLVDDQERRLDSLARDRESLRARVGRYRGIIRDSQVHMVGTPRALWDRIDVALGGDDGD